ncbi:hypothetical protein [Neptunicella marina]|uniref:Uncharacterized protein n=1 Tax=Neptunicella marina TaxID=2125989 RepID=A0A8J6M0A9_9ALTE|nr:hypothetical protein [Neptunicella marina]MBC3767049.1 hypothetical protein [Neptunicella marina]
MIKSRLFWCIASLIVMVVYAYFQYQQAPDGVHLVAEGMHFETAATPSFLFGLFVAAAMLLMLSIAIACLSLMGKMWFKLNTLLGARIGGLVALQSLLIVVVTTAIDTWFYGGAL